MTQKEALDTVKSLIAWELPGYELKPDMITGKTFAVVDSATGMAISNYYKPSDLLILREGFYMHAYRVACKHT